MKKLYGLAILLPLISASTNAQENLEACKSVEQLATTVMTARQLGLPMSKVMPRDSEGAGKLTQSMTIMAYEMPRFSTKDGQQKAVQDFSDRYYLECSKSVLNRTR